ncbi:MAG: hypothetical protein ACRD0U_03150, partial [Acidimicrobiales bacterium]
AEERRDDSGAGAGGTTTTIAPGALDATPANGDLQSAPPSLPPATRFGAIADEVDLVDVVERLLEERAADTTTSSVESSFASAAHACVDPLAEGDPDRAGVVAYGPADYDGTAAAVVVFERDDGSREVVAARVSDCRILARAEL